jgi:ElaB/YqjD/DUF883 family membrane-anchored ribosome-binding protein
MTQSTAKATKENLLNDFNVLIKDVEQLRKSIDKEGHEADSVRAKVAEKLNTARERLQRIEDAALQYAKARIRSADDHMHKHPWQAIGAAAGLAIVIGFFLNRRSGS